MQGKLYMSIRRNAKVIISVVLIALIILAVRFEAIDVEVISKDMTVTVKAR